MTKLKSFVLASLAVSSIASVHAQFGMGLTFDPRPSARLPFSSPAKLGFASELPASYSMRKYTPYVKNQGVYPSCAGWAVSYEALSTQHAIAYGLTNRNLITAKAFCPYYSYNKANPGDPGCKYGSAVAQNMLTLMNEGSKKFYLPLLGCGTTIADEFSYASQYYKVSGAYQLKNVWPESVAWDNTDIKTTFQNFFNAAHPMDVKVFKQYLYENTPIVISVALPSSFMGLRSELWEPTAEEKADPTAAVMQNTGGHRAHAMTVIGYDDTKYGGAFEVMNSWSESWGDDGYFWIKYDDFKTYVYDAYYMEIFQPEATMITKTGVIWGDCMNGYGFVRGTNGESYEGQFKGGKFDGYGVYTWPNGHAYAGQWKDGKREGEANCYYADGSYGKVEYVNDAFVSGYNVLNYTNGDSYKGYLKNNKFEGYGEYTLASGARIIAMFSEGKMNGLAKVFEADGATFLGYYADGKQHGKGIYVSADKKITAGEWVYGTYLKERTFGYADPKDMKTGAGISSSTYLAADCISGNCLTGEGKRTTSNGNTYYGSFVDGLEDGKGEMTYSTGTLNGSWKQGHPYGIGEFKSVEGWGYLSEFKKGAREGYVLWYNTAGNLLVTLESGGMEIATYKEIVSNTSASVGASIPNKLHSNPAVINKLN